MQIKENKYFLKKAPLKIIVKTKIRKIQQIINIIDKFIHYNLKEPKHKNQKTVYLYILDSKTNGPKS